MCAIITGIPDFVVENTESFQVVLNSSDPAVVLSQSTATVNIFDIDGKYFPMKVKNNNKDYYSVVLYVIELFGLISCRLQHHICK